MSKINHREKWGIGSKTKLYQQTDLGALRMLDALYISYDLYASYHTLHEDLYTLSEYFVRAAVYHIQNIKISKKYPSRVSNHHLLVYRTSYCCT